MEQLFMVAYRYRDRLDGDDLRELTKKFVEFGEAPGTIAHYERLDGQGGFVLRKDPDDLANVYKLVIEYSPWIQFEVTPVTTIEEAFPVIQSVYG